jgi:hypothetical protein
MVAAERASDVGAVAGHPIDRASLVPRATKAEDGTFASTASDPLAGETWV